MIVLDNIDQFVGNKNVIKNIYNELKNPPCGILIIGPTGCGKTVLCDLLLQKSNIYHVLKINGEDSDSKGIKKLVDNFITHKTIESFFSKQPKLVWFDDIDIFLTTDRGTNSYILNFITDAIKNKNISFILTACISEEKRLTELKKKVPPYRLCNPSLNDCFVFVSNYLDNAETDYDSTKLMKFIEAYNCNIRSIFQNINHINSSDAVLDYEKRSRTLFDNTNYDLMKKLFKIHLQLSDIKLVSDIGLVPLLMYENYIDELFGNKVKISKQEYLKRIQYVQDCNIHAEILENNMYCQTDWSLWDVIPIMKCGSINKILTDISIKKKPQFDKYVFTQSLTKSALKCNYEKKIIIFKKLSHIYETKNIYILLDILGTMMNDTDQDTKKIKEIIKTYFEYIAKDDIDCFSAIQLYLGQIREMDKKLLSKMKKIML